MKKVFTLFFTVLMLITVLTGCGTAKADFESPEAVVEAYLEKNPIESETVYDLNTDFAGKTVRVKTNEKGDPVIKVYENVSLSTGIYVMLESDTVNTGNFNYKVGDTLVFRIKDIMMRSFKDGKFKDIYINVEPVK